MQMAQTAIRPAVVDFVELATSAENLELSMEEITIGSTSPLANQSIIDANLRQRFGVIVVGIQRADRRMEFNPEPDATIRAGDKLVVLGRPESLKSLESGGVAEMTARMLDGVAVAHAIRAEVRPEVEAFAARTGRPPGLALVLVGNDPASELYVGSKLKSAGETGSARRHRTIAGDQRRSTSCCV